MTKMGELITMVANMECDPPCFCGQDPCPKIVADFILQREKDLLDEIERPLKNHGAELDCPECDGKGWYAQQVSDTEQEQRPCNCNNGRVFYDGVGEAMSIIEQKRKEAV